MIQTVRRPVPGTPPARHLGLRLAVRSAYLAIAALPAEAQKITEVVADHFGADTPVLGPGFDGVETAPGEQDGKEQARR